MLSRDGRDEGRPGCGRGDHPWDAPGRVRNHELLAARSHGATGVLEAPVDSLSHILVAKEVAKVTKRERETPFLYLSSKLQFSENFQLGWCTKGKGHGWGISGKEVN